MTTPLVTGTVAHTAEKISSTWEVTLRSDEAADRLIPGTAPFRTPIIVDGLSIEAIVESGENDILIVSALGRLLDTNRSGYQVFATPPSVRTADLDDAPEFVVQVLRETLPAKFHYLLSETS
jgi:hypothetical protein